MSNPALARNDEAGDRLYTFGDPPESFWSVTTMIGGGVPKYLVPWASKLVAELAHEAILERGPNSRAGAILRRLAQRGRAEVLERQARGELTSIKVAKLTPQELALRWLKGQPDRVRDAAAQLGTEVHASAEELVLEHAREATRLYLDAGRMPVWPDHLGPHLTSFRAFLEDWHPEFLAAEATVFNRTQAYAGTLDAVIRIPAGELVTALEASGNPAATVEQAGIYAWLRDLGPGSPVDIVTDYKSGREIYPDVALQLSAYSRAEFVGHPDGVTELPMPAVQLGAVLHLTPKRYRLRLVRIDEPVWQSFLYAREVYRWTKEIAGTALLQDLTPAAKEAA